jgi:dipeptidase D
MDFLISVPNGVFEMSVSLPDLVLVSGNLAAIRTKSSSAHFKDAKEMKESENGSEKLENEPENELENEPEKESEKDADASDLDIYTKKSKRELEIVFKLRSGSEIKQKEKIRELMALSKKHHFHIEMTHYYSPWEADFTSDFLKSCADVYSKTFGKEAKVTAMHAGLECGVFHRLFPEMKMISIGPDITAAHTPDETLNLAAAENVWIFLKEILGSFSNENG